MVKIKYISIFTFLICACSNSVSADNKKDNDSQGKDSIPLFTIESENLYVGKVINFEKSHGLFSMLIREYPKRLKMYPPVKYNVRHYVYRYENDGLNLMGKEKIHSMEEWRSFKDYTESIINDTLPLKYTEGFFKEFELKDGRRLKIETISSKIEYQQAVIQITLGDKVQRITTDGMVHFADYYDLYGDLKIFLASTVCNALKGCSDILLVLKTPSEN